MNVDLSLAARELGIDDEITIVPANLNNGWPPELAAIFGSLRSGMTTPEKLDTIYVDWDALRFGTEHPEIWTDASVKDEHSAENTIAHELVHLAQFRQGSAEEVAREYARELEKNGYRDNRFEVEARELAKTLSKFVTVTP